MPIKTTKLNPELQERINVLLSEIIDIMANEVQGFTSAIGHTEITENTETAIFTLDIGIRGQGILTQYPAVQATKAKVLELGKRYYTEIRPIADLAVVTVEFSDWIDCFTLDAWNATNRNLISIKLADTIEQSLDLLEILVAGGK